MKIILTGSTGMVGEGVLYVCLEHPMIEKVLVLNRRPCEFEHPKLKEVLHPDFSDLTAIQDQLSGYDACFFCAGVSSVGMKTEEFRHITYDLTIGFAETLKSANPQLIFCYISGSGTRSDEKGMMWARVKGKTENDLVKLMHKAYNFRPAFIKPRKYAKNILSWYKYVGWMYYIGHPLFPNYFCTSDEIGHAMINAVVKDYSHNILEVRDIKKLARN
jgi:uncharacterized protein YbjT (DUF2867 family)